MSIFVNPSQFAPHEDLAKYPRTLDRDVQLLQTLARPDVEGDSGVDCVIVPSVKDMYPSGITLDVSKQVGTFVEVRGKSHQMYGISFTLYSDSNYWREGVVRPHFFRGVATVVSKLFNIVQPTHAFFGQKDAQQCVVIHSLIKDLCFPIQLVIGETVRHSDGLAMSSRNAYLSPDDRIRGLALYKGLNAGVKIYNDYLAAGKTPTRQEIVNAAEKVIRSEQGVQFEYLSLAHPLELHEYESEIDTNRGAIFSGAIRVGSTRLIDNLLIGRTTDTWFK